MDNGLHASFALVLAGILVYWFRERSKGSQVPLPPGPPSLPILGNVLDIPPTEPWITYKQWGAKYGDVFRVRLLTENAIVLNSLETAKLLLEQRSHIYSSRPHLAVIDLLGTNWNTGFLPYGDKLRLQRKVFQPALRAEGVVVHRPIQLRRARELVKNLLEGPSEYKEHFEMHATSIIMSAAYDYHPAARDDPVVTKIQTVLSTLIKLVTPEFSAVINAFPWLIYLPAWFPGATFQRTAASFRASLGMWVDEPFEYVRKKASDGSLGPCMVGDALAQISEDDTNAQEVQQAIKEAAAATFGAGSETTASALQIFVLAMTLYPEVQKRAYKEIETLVGSKRLPNFCDRPRLPYIEAVLRETLRWHPVTPLSLPHSTTQDDIYQGYMIPQGVTIIANVWAMTHDENKYANPSTFNPDRFFDDSGALNNDTVSYIFGFGRRICTGRYLADASLWSAMVTLLAAVEFQDPDSNGLEAQAQRMPRFTTALTSKPESFNVRVLPRFDAEELAALLKADD
ncbi:cytochrome P450 [Phlebopus sp. FC_14]|nr:cytochrome P450 [Phlebopus sp. FC_14]